MSYKIAIACLNGHIISRDMNTNSSYRTMTHCPHCGLQLTNICLHCESPIHGNEVNDRGQTIHSSKPLDAFCYNCGKPYPWTESALENAELIINELDCLSDQEKEKLNKFFKDLIQETPKTPYAILIAKKTLSVCTGFLKESLTNLIISSACEAVKKELGF